MGQRPIVAQDKQDVVEPFAYLAEKMGRFLVQLAEGRLEKVEVIYGGELSQLNANTRFITRLALKGLLDPILQVPVNIVNAEFVAKERGIAFSETITDEAAGFKSLLTIRVKTDKMEESMSATVFFKGRSRIVAIGGYTMDMIPEGYVIVSRHLDKPGVIGRHRRSLARTTSASPYAGRADQPRGRGDHGPERGQRGPERGHGRDTGEGRDLHGEVRETLTNER
jgi:D-3-phosphoglycerate dehydrogenase